MQADFDLIDSGSIWILTALTEAGYDWIAENLPADALTFGPGIAIEKRYVDDIAQGIAEDGLTIE